MGTEVAVGGGGSSSNTHALDISIPLRNGAPATSGLSANGWRVSHDDDSNRTLTVYVICAT